MSGPTLTAFIGNYNHAASVGRAIEAMATQSRPPDELIVVDDASTDDSVAVIEPYLAKIPYMRLIRHPENRKLSGAILSALAVAKGDFFYSGAADDYVLPGFFERAMRVAAQKPDIGIILGQMVVCDMAGREEGVYGSSVWREDLCVDAGRFRREFLLTEPATHVCSASLMFRTGPFREQGGFRLELGSVADNFIMRYLGAKYGCGYVHHPCSVWFRNEGSMSAASSTNPWWNLDQGARVAWLMRYRADGVFREEDVCAWEASFRKHAIHAYSELIRDQHRRIRAAYRRGTEHAGTAGRLFRWATTGLHDLVAWAQDRSVRRVLSAYKGNLDCYRTETPLS